MRIRSTVKFSDGMGDKELFVNDSRRGSQRVSLLATVVNDDWSADDDLECSFERKQVDFALTREQREALT